MTATASSKLRAPAVIGRGHLANAVADDRVWLDPPRRPERGETRLDGKDRRLGDRRLLEARCGLLAGQLLEERPRAAEAGDELVTPLDHVAEDRLFLEKLTTHRPPLRSLAGEDERQPHDVTREESVGHGGRVGVVLARRPRVARSAPLSEWADDAEPIVVMGPAEPCRMGEVFERDPGAWSAGCEERRADASHRLEGLGCPRGQGNELGAASRERFEANRGVPVGAFLEHDAAHCSHRIRTS